MKVRVLSILFSLSCFFAVCANAFELPKIHGFSENAAGVKISEDDKANKRGINLFEQRMQFKLRYFPDRITVLEDWQTEVFLKADALMDEYAERFFLNLKEAYITSTPFDFLDIKVGRQVLTWGTGDYVFINDMFPKDYESFLIGREDEYLKRPSYALRAMFFSQIATLDIAVIPYFTPNKAVTGDRLSFFDPLRAGIVGRVSDRKLLRPPFQFENTEAAFRLYGTLDSYEWAGYYFRGFYKNPMGYKEEANSILYYPELDVFGASLRGPVPILGGIVNGELGYFNSREDTAGKDRLIPNPSMKYLIGYKRSFKNDLEIGLQYYLDHMLYWDNYKESLLAQDSRDDEVYQQYSLRITKLMARQTLRLSFFTFYSPVDNDIYLRPLIQWDATDRWKVSLGANIFIGQQTNGDYSQYTGNNNIYTRVRYSF